MDKRRIKIKYFSSYHSDCEGEKLAQKIEDFYNNELSPNEGIILGEKFFASEQRIHCFITYYFPEKMEDVNLYW